MDATAPTPTAGREAHAPRHVDVAVIGSGAAGLMAAIFAGRTIGAMSGARHAVTAAANSAPRVIALDGAKIIGAKILVAGGGRCNVTHYAVDESAYAGSTRPAIRNVLRRFDVDETVLFFRELGVELKREETGKLFPTTDDAHTVLHALINGAKAAGVELRHPWRVDRVEREGDGFLVYGQSGMEPVRARRVVLATGGMALPKTGSDGHGYTIARHLGHTTTARIFPSLVPLTLPRDHPLCQLSGLTHRATLELRASSSNGGRKKLVSFTNSTLCTHFGLSGPSVLDISRYFLDELAEAKVRAGGAAKASDLPTLHINWLPAVSLEAMDKALLEAAQRHGQLSAARWLSEVMTIETPLSERLARALCWLAGVDGSAPLHALTKDKRRMLAQACTELPLPISGDRGFVAAEVTAGGVPLSEVQLKTMESRACPGLYLCGEICDVDGRIGGFNFQWAWASGFVAGTAAGEAVQAAAVVSDKAGTAGV